MDAKTVGRKVVEEQDIHTVLKCYPTDYLLIIKGRNFLYNGVTQWILPEPNDQTASPDQMGQNDKMRCNVGDTSPV